jgi:dipeptidyl aminopeptidase/acylaminoacyl peptidase
MVSGGIVATLSATLITILAINPAPAIACAPPARNAGTSETRPISTIDLARLRDIGMPDSSFFDMSSPLALSPDGSKVAFVVNQGDPETNSYCRLMMVADVLPNASPLVVDKGGELITIVDNYRGLLVSVGFPDLVTPGWSPDGRWIAYLRRDGGVTQLWRARSNGGEAAAVTQSKVDIDGWAWLSNDRVVITSLPERIAEEARIDAEGRTGWLYDARIAPEYDMRPQIRADLSRRFEVIDLATGTITVATAAEAARLTPERLSRILVPQTIMNRRGGRAWIQTDDASPLSPARVRFLDGRGHEKHCSAEPCANGIVQIHWSTDGKSIIYLRREGWAKSRMAFYRWDPEHGSPERLSVTDDVLLGCIPRGARFFCTREASTVPRQIAEVDPVTGVATTVYDPNPEFASLQLGSVERLTWRNALGLPAWGDLVLPPGHLAGEKLPMIVVQYHSDGFLRGGTGDEYPILALAARGFAVLSVEDPPTFAAAFPNLKTWDEINAANMKDWAERRSVLSSILTGVSLVVERGIVDPKRIGITGLSDGASSARFALINSRVFSAAAISSCCLEPKTAMTYGGTAWADYNRKMGYPPATQDAPAFWQPYSMALNAKEMDAPLLMQLADEESLLALETFTALRENDKPVEMYIYPQEHHIKWQPQHRLAIYDRNIDWFAFWFQDVIDPSPVKAAQYDRWRAMRARRAKSLTSLSGSMHKP